MSLQTIYERRNAKRRAKLLAQKALVPRDVLPGETWLPAVGFEGRYEVSDRGRVRSLNGDRRHGIVLKNSLDGHGYAFVRLTGEAGQVRASVHTLVCEAFNGPRAGAPLCRHLDDDRLRNVPSNLAWGTKSDNGRDAVRNGRLLGHPKLTASEVEAIIAAEPRRCLHRDLATQYGVSASTITRYRRTLSGKVVPR